MVRGEQGRESGAPFYGALALALRRRGVRLDELCPQTDVVARRVLEEYGSIFVASERVVVPHRCVFESEDEVLSFQREAGWSAATFPSARTEQTEVVIELQPPAMEALLAARDEAAAQGLQLTARGGAEAGRRTFADTVRLWDSRCHPALDHWCSRGRLADDEAERLRRLGLNEQVEAVLALEQEGMFFSTDFTKSILLSVAAPGASQHLAMLAFDIFEFRDERVRRVLARHGWFQTVVSDLPHFTYLGLEEEELPRRGLRRVRHAAQTFWIPDLGKDEGCEAQDKGL
ncbi:MAG TPA: hypothetical protein VER32_00210 [Pyrinomonadaceae bacterium]|nr:hypothetical protein [Pyrinomonadaceae bacterium]